MRSVELFLEHQLCGFFHATHCGGLSAYNTAAERLNAAETRSIVNIPIDASAYGPAIMEDGAFDPAVAYANYLWELDELELRLQLASFCGHNLQVHQAASMTG